jgi:16S rRNA (cytosine967-C5)-methyltransferase
VQPGGRLVYATCSLLAAENEEQMAWFFDSHPDFAPVRVDAIWSRVIGPPPMRDLYLKLSPARHGTDGFFVAVAERYAANTGANEKT